MRVIVFGGTGWLGHHIVSVFHDAGHEVTICCRGKKQTYLGEIPNGIRTVKGDKNNEGDSSKILAAGYDVVIDSVPTVKSIDNIVNHGGDIKHYLHCSSTGGYAPLPFVPGDETMPYRGFRSMGGWVQNVEVDDKVLTLHRDSSFPATVIRPSYITGPGMLPLDNLGGRRKDFIADVINSVPLDVPNAGQALLQPVNICDLAKAFLLAIERPESIGEIYNICLDKAVTINRYLEITGAALGCQVTLNYMPITALLKKYEGRVNEVGLHFLAEHMCFDIAKAKTQLGYSPHCTTDQAIIETAHWARDQLGLI